MCHHFSWADTPLLHIYQSLLGDFPALKFSFAYFNPDKEESKKAAPKLFIPQKNLKEAANV